MLLSKDGAEYPIRALVDSGADCSCFPEDFAEVLGVNLEQCEQRPVNTGNGLAVHYSSDEPIRATIAEREVLLTCSFGPVGVPVLGRDDFFAEFLVTVDHRKRVVVLTPHEP